MTDQHCSTNLCKNAKIMISAAKETVLLLALSYRATILWSSLILAKSTVNKISGSMNFGKWFYFSGVTVFIEIFWEIGA